MSYRTLLFGLVVVALGFSVSCSFPPFEHSAEFPTLPGIHQGQSADEVIKELGHPQARENGWWRQSVWFDMEFNVWYYKGKGRVIFYFHDTDLLHRELLVYTSEADDRQLGRAESPEPVERYINK